MNARWHGHGDGEMMIIRCESATTIPPAVAVTCTGLHLAAVSGGLEIFSSKREGSLVHLGSTLKVGRYAFLRELGRVVELKVQR
jgi:hypothetical protein